METQAYIASTLVGATTIGTEAISPGHPGSHAARCGADINSFSIGELLAAFPSA